MSGNIGRGLLINKGGDGECWEGVQRFFKGNERGGVIISNDHTNVGKLLKMGIIDRRAINKQ